MLDAGIELAFGPLFRPVAYVECEAHAVAVLAAAMESGRINTAPVWSDARTVCGPQFSHYVREKLAGERLGAIVAGYPCPDFSCAGKRAGLRGVKGALWWSLAEAITEYEPELLFLENVGGHTSKGFDTVCAALRAMGYRVAAGLFTASETGANHERERLFILADADRRRTTAGQVFRRCDAAAQGKGGGEFQFMRGGPELADAGGAGCQGSELRRTRGQVERIEASGPIAQFRLPLFPPGPDDIDAWRTVLEIDPTLEPAICRMADGMANRAQQLRLLGNGVVALEAAYAYTTIGACLWG